MKIAYLFLNGELRGNKNFYLNFIEHHKGDIYCADGGANICYELNLTPKEIYGDLDSIKNDVKEFYQEKDVNFVKFKVEKDYTDSELVLNEIQDKYDMIEAYQRRLFETIQYVFEKNNGNIHATMLETFEFLKGNQIYAALLSENGSKEIHQFMLQKLKELIQSSFFPQSKHLKLGKLGEIYATTYYANAIFGTTQSWIRRKQKETPTQIANLLVELIN